MDRVSSDLMQRIGRKDQSAFRELYNATSAHLFAIALRIVRQRDLAEDVLQESFVSIWDRALDYDPVRGSVMNWLVTIVRHRAIDTLRRLNVRPEGASSGDEALAFMASSSDTATDRGADRRALDRCLGELDELPRQVVVYAYAFGYTHEELAARFKTPLGTIKSWIRRSLDRLKHCLDG
ncbi:MAG TPA: sigma-70 family RNA polymerase sigma factor [Magnetospirillaceae bacterium]|jgi:RNA polymerase sigma-70 factor (ECF subfamily)